MNRQERRSAKKAIPAYRRNASPEELIKRMSVHGITPQDYDAWGESEYKRGLHEGYVRSGEETVKACYAAVCIAVSNLYDFDNAKCYDLLTEIDETIADYINSTELVDAVWDKVGLHIDFNDPLERVKEIE